MELQLRTVNRSEAHLIEILFKEVYNRPQGIMYWKWCFSNPYGYINVGAFKDSELIGYYACHLTERSGCVVSAMVHPEYRRQGVFMKLSKELHRILKYFRTYVYLFSNEVIRSIHIHKEGYKEAYQIKEYRVLVNDRNFITYVDSPRSHFEVWRYQLHPSNQYFMRCDVEGKKRFVFNTYENRLQIVEYEDLKYALCGALSVADKTEGIDTVAFWSEKDLEYDSITLHTWKQYKILNEQVSYEEVIGHDKTRMGMSDVF